MIKRHANGRLGRRRKTVLAAMAMMLMVLPAPEAAKVLAAEVQSYTVSIEELKGTEPEELPEYGAVKTADGNKSTAVWLAVLLLGTGWILDRIYLSNREEDHDGR